MWKFSLRIILAFFNLNSSTVCNMHNTTKLPVKALVRLFVLATLVVAPFTPQASLAQTPAAGIVFSEILANALDENTGEFVEIINAGGGPIDLSTWVIVDASGARHGLVSFPRELGFGLRQTVLDPGQIGLILDQDYAGEYAAPIAELPDGGANLVLLGSSRGNLSLANSSDGLTLIDGAGANMGSFSWTSDPGSEIPFSRLRDLAGTLGELLPDETGLSIGQVKSKLPPAPPIPPTLRISELLPNPVGSDTSEWIELENVGVDLADLSFVRVRDASGTGNLLEGELGAGEFLVVTTATSGLSQNNSGDTLELLFAPTGLESLRLDLVTYQEAPEGQSWARFGDTLTWTTKPTPGVANVLEEPAIEEEEPRESEKETELAEEVAAQPLLLDSLSEAKDADAGELVSVSGIIATPVGLFYKDKFFLVDQTAGIVVRVGESSAKPSLGEHVRLIGSLTQLKHYPQLTLTQDPEQLDPVETPIPDRSPETISKDDVGRLVRVQGKVSKKQGSSFRLAKEDRDILVSIRKGTGIKTTNTKKGEDRTVTGIVLASGANLVVAPRSLDDLGLQQKKAARLLASGSPHWPLVLVSIFLGGSYSFYLGFARASDAKSSRGVSGQSKSYEDHDGQ
jgi:hypothetical protein